MLTSVPVTLAVLLGAVTAHPSLTPRQANPCFVVGNTALPEEVVDVNRGLADRVTCSNTETTIGEVPDVTSGSTSFSSINFDASNESPLNFALSEFAANPPSAADLQLFQERRDVYEATEAGIRSVGGNLDIKVPKFFLSFQIARIRTAQGETITDAGSTVEHLLGKVTKNAGKEDQATIDQVTALAEQLN